MIAALSLVGYALAVALMVPRLLDDASWTSRAPRLAIATWQAITASVVAAMVFAGLVLVAPASSVAGGIAGLLRSCAMAIRTAYASAGGIALVGSGLVLAGAVTIRTGWCLAAALYGAARAREQHRDMLRLVGRESKPLRATVVDCDAAAAYCVPGRVGQVVLTTGALTALSKEQLAAVLAHEHAHLRGRHHLVLATAQGMMRAFPKVPLFTCATQEVTRLVEMLADDAAARRNGRTVVATALVALASSLTPTATLSASGPTALIRVRRLLAPAQPLSRSRTAAGVGLVALALLAPLAIALAPASASIGMTWCARSHATHTTQASPESLSATEIRVA